MAKVGGKTAGGGNARTNGNLVGKKTSQGKSHLTHFKNKHTKRLKGKRPYRGQGK